MDALLAWETNLVLAFQSVYGLDGIMSAFTFLGNEEFFLFVMPLLYWCLNAGLGARTAVMLIASNGLADLLKLSFALPRPYWIDQRVTAFTTEVSYAQPSSHTMNATAVWSFLAAQARRRWAWPAAIVLIVMIAL